MSESEIGEHVVAWLAADGWDVYQEVQPRRGPVADVVAVRGSVVLVVELKKSLTFAVLAQAWRWAGWAHMRAVAVPRARRRGWRRPDKDPARYFAEHVAGRYGIGVLEVDVRHGRSGVDWTERPEFVRRPPMAVEMRGALRPEHKTYARAGAAGGGYFTPFNATVVELKRWLAAHPGATMREAVAGITHHYASNRAATAALRKWIGEGVIAGVRVDRAAKPWRLYVDAAP